MAPSSMVERLLASAEDFLRLKPRSAAYRRRAVSTAYYAVFHAIAGLCTQALLPRGGSQDDVVRIYRALDHGPLRNAFGQSPLRDDLTFKTIGVAVLNLQAERHRADYLPPDKSLFPEAEARELIAQARAVIKQIEGLGSEERRMLATCLLFKDRKS